MTLDTALLVVVALHFMHVLDRTSQAWAGFVGAVSTVLGALAHGWLVLLWGIVLLPVGFGVQAIALLRSQSLPRWQSLLFLVGVLFIATPDGVEIVNLTASVLLAVAFVPYGVGMIRTGVTSST